MTKGKKTCPNCHLQVEEGLEKCPFCGASLDNKEEVKEEVVVNENNKKLKIQRHTLFYLIGLGLGLILFGFMALPGESNIGLPIYFWAFVSERTTVSGTEYVIGGNAATIVFVFSIVSVLNQLAILRSVRKKSTEIPLFSYFSAFFFVVNAIVSFTSSLLMSFKTSGTAATQFSFGFGFAIVGVISIAAAVLDILAVIDYKKFIKSSPFESFKHE